MNNPTDTQVAIAAIDTTFEPLHEAAHREAMDAANALEHAHSTGDECYIRTARAWAVSASRAADAIDTAWAEAVSAIKSTDITDRLRAEWAGTGASESRAH